MSLHSKEEKKNTKKHDLSIRDSWRLTSFWDITCIFFLSPSLLRPVGMPKMEKVYLHNPSSEEISLISISATTAHFHASFFQNRVSTCLVYNLYKGHTQQRSDVCISLLNKGVNVGFLLET